MIRRSVLIGGLAACLASIAIACGPEFPWQLLDDRPGTLRATPANGFDFEAARLVAPPAGILRVEEAQVRSAEPAFADQLARAEAEGASSAVVATVKAMRRQPSGDAAYENGAGAPEAVRLYTAGAVDYRADDSAAARERFEAVLALPAAEARERAVWAAYMVGRIALLGDDAAATAGAFARTRAIAAAGAPDPLGLALASYGEEARMHLREARAIATDEAEVPADASAAYGAAMSRAVALYALQAAAGSQRGLLSLRIVAEELLKDRTRIDAVIADPVTRNLLVAYVLALVGDEPPTDAVGYDGGPRLDAGSDRRVTPNAALIRLVEAIERAGLKDVRGADRIAALAYRTGRLDLAGRAANLEDTALSHWVRAKFAVRRGDLDAAAAAYAAAAKAFPASPRVLDEAAGQLLSGERGVLSLARGEYREALRFLVAGPHPFWGDAAYVAERVLTVDELKQMLAPDIVRGGPVATTPETLASLRDLLARRLMREGRYREALPFFKDDANSGTGQSLCRRPRPGGDPLVAREPGPGHLRSGRTGTAPRPRDHGHRGPAGLRRLGRQFRDRARAGQRRGRVRAAGRDGAGRGERPTPEPALALPLPRRRPCKPRRRPRAAALTGFRGGPVLGRSLDAADAEQRRAWTGALPPLRPRRRGRPVRDHLRAGMPGAGFRAPRPGLPPGDVSDDPPPARVGVKRGAHRLPRSWREANALRGRTAISHRGEDCGFSARP